MPRTLIDPRLDTSLPDTAGSFFANRLTVQTETEVRDEYGEVTSTWADVAGWHDIPCHIGRRRSELASERRTGSLTERIDDKAALMQGFYLITLDNQVTDENGTAYNVVRVDHSEAAFTSLGLEVVA